MRLPCSHNTAAPTYQPPSLPPAPADAASVVVGMRAGVGRVAVGCCVGIDAVTWPCHLLVAASSSLADFRARRHACGRLSRAAPACERSAGRPGRMPAPPRALSGVAGVLWGDSVKLCVAHCSALEPWLQLRFFVFARAGLGSFAIAHCVHRDSLTLLYTWVCVLSAVRSVQNLL